PNIMIGSAAKLTFGDFVINLLPVISINIILFTVVAYFIFRKKMVVTNENRARIMDFDETKFFTDKSFLIKSIIVFTLLLIGFAIHGFIDLEASSIALSAATVLLVITKIDPDSILKEVEWGTIFFFIGLFIIVGALVENGVIAVISTKMLEYTHSDIKLTSQIVIWFSAVFSAVVDNIPFVATMIPIIQDMGASLPAHSLEPVWWSLSLGSCLGGNGTLIGASANIIVAGFAKKAGYPITFISFLKYSIPLTAMTVLVSYFYIMFRYF
ncbi:anion permease, partial [bacterium]|nr:anion permease [bacterium]